MYSSSMGHISGSSWVPPSGSDAQTGACLEVAEPFAAAEAPTAQCVLPPACGSSADPVSCFLAPGRPTLISIDYLGA